MVTPDQESTTPDESTEVNEPPTLDSLSERIKSLQDENDKLGKDLSAAKGQSAPKGIEIGSTCQGWMPWAVQWSKHSVITKTIPIRLYVIWNSNSI